jgi:hypothetical protein
MTLSAVVLLPAASVANHLGWWCPTHVLLERIAPKCEVKLRGGIADEDGGVSIERTRAVWVSVERREGVRLYGTVTDSFVDRDGYRRGDHIEADVDRVFDVVFHGADGRPLMNEDRARFALGKGVLVGVTEVSTSDEVLAQRQFFGVIESADPRHGLSLRLANGELRNLPPDVRGLEEAPPGEYRLRSTGEVVKDPDFTMTWLRRAPPADDRPPARTSSGSD